MAVIGILNGILKTTILKVVVSGCLKMKGRAFTGTVTGLPFMIVKIVGCTLGTLILVMTIFLEITKKEEFNWGVGRAVECV